VITIGPDMFESVKDIYALPAYRPGWRITRTKYSIKLGKNVIMGDNVKLGSGIILGNNVALGKWVRLGDEVELGNNVMLGERVELGNLFKLGRGVTLGDGVTSTSINNRLIAQYKAAAEYHYFIKWVTKDRKSPGSFGEKTYLDGDTPPRIMRGLTMSMLSLCWSGSDRRIYVLRDTQVLVARFA